MSEMMGPKYQYKADVVRVVDGDTYEANVDLGFKVVLGVTLRLADYDTKELRDKDEESRAKAKEAKEWVEGMVLDKPVVVITRKTRAGKERRTFGRYVSEVYYEGVEGTWHNLGEDLHARGLARKV